MARYKWTVEVQAKKWVGGGLIAESAVERDETFVLDQVEARKLFDLLSFMASDADGDYHVRLENHKGVILQSYPV